ncbi:YbhN family protein [Thermodesulfobacteriota bacterium]
MTEYPKNETAIEGESKSAGSFWAAFLGYAVVGLFLSYCGYYVYSRPQEFAFVKDVSIPELISAAVLVIVSVLISAFQLLLFFRNFGVSLGLLELFALAMSSGLGNLVLPMRGGTAGMAVYLKKVHGLDFKAFAVIYAGTGLLMALVNTGMAVLGLGLVYLTNGFFDPLLSAVVLCLFGACLYFSLFPPPVRWKRGGLLGIVFDTAHSWHLLTRDRPLLLKLTLLFTMVPVTLTGAFHFIYQALGSSLPLSAVLVVSSLGNVANLVPIVPGALGVFDAVTIQIPKIFGLDPAVAIASALTYRVLLFGWCISLGVPGIFYLMAKAR